MTLLMPSSRSINIQQEPPIDNLIEERSTFEQTATLKNRTNSHIFDVSPNTSSSLFEISQLTESLYLCGACALRADSFSKLRITCVINCTTLKELPDPPLPDCVTQYHRVPVTDSSDTDLSEYFHIIPDIIHRIITSSGRVLIHCVAGASRSVSLCLAYLIKYHQMTLKTAYSTLKQLRPCVRPSSEFFAQLIEFERQLHRSSSVSMVYDDFQKKYIPDVYRIKLPEMYRCLANSCQKRNCGMH